MQPWSARSLYLESPAGLRRLVLLLYALVAPPFVALLALQAPPADRAWAVGAVVLLCAMGAGAVAWRREPPSLAWTLAGGVVPPLCCGVAYRVTGEAGHAFLAVLGAPLAWSAVLFDRRTTVAAWATAVATSFVVVAAEAGPAAGALDAALVAIVFALVGAVVQARTQRHREAAEARRAADAQRRYTAALVEVMQEAVVALGPDGKVTTWSRGARQLFGWSAEEVVGRSPFEFLVPPGAAAELQTAFEVATALGATTQLGPRRHKGGGEVVVHSNIVRLQDEEGRPAGFLGVLRDVTARQAAERALRESQERLVLALAGAETEIWEWDLVRGWLQPGPRWAELLGGSETGLPARTPEDLAAFAHADDRAEVAARIRAHLAGESRLLHVEARIPVPGGVRWVAMRGRAGEPGPSGSPARLLGTFRDISVRKALEADRERALAEARTATQRREQLLAVVAHDLRSPLAAISLTAHAIHRVIESPDAAEELEERGDLIRLACDRMSRLIEDLLDVAAIQNGQLRVALAPADPAALARACVSQAQPLAERRGVTLALEAEPVPAAIPCDAARLQQVLGNLLGNALQATEPGGSVTLRLRAAGGSVLFSVLDTGRGLPPGEPERLFTPYQRGENLSHKGAGLGLAIARGIVDRHGGRIWAERREPRGSAFHVSLPVAPPDPLGEALPAPSGAVAP